ncbi:MAG: hypothetical protein A2285_07335 [Elusimicrobia bacterium RIFOXYA12_FULL_57_11]|nr:MAG: hypothetical protein A2285_07335 [Elusimicrobia bacterium RIFOXYA12_FULL_57_11]
MEYSEHATVFYKITAQAFPETRRPFYAGRPLMPIKKAASKKAAFCRRRLFKGGSPEPGPVHVYGAIRPSN